MLLFASFIPAEQRRLLVTAVVSSLLVASFIPAEQHNLLPMFEQVVKSIIANKLAVASSSATALHPVMDSTTIRFPVKCFHCNSAEDSVRATRI